MPVPYNEYDPTSRPKRYATLAAIGAVTDPVLGAMADAIVGKGILRGAKPHRWLLGRATRGALVGSGLAAVRDWASKADYEKFQRSQNLLHRLAPAGIPDVVRSASLNPTVKVSAAEIPPEEATPKMEGGLAARRLEDSVAKKSLQCRLDPTKTAAYSNFLSYLDKIAASYHMSRHIKSRDGRRPIRVDTLLKNEKRREIEVPVEKKAADSGVDLRTPLMGGVKFPTDASLAFSRQQLKSSQETSEPRVPRGAKIKDMIPSYKQAGMPKVGSAMNVENDPLIQYLQKCSEQLENNLDAMPRSEEEDSRARERPTPEPHEIKDNEEVQRGYMRGQLVHGGAMRAKDTSYPYDEGVLNRILGTDQ